MSKARELAELGAVYDSGALSNRNLIINGAMTVAQRYTSVNEINETNDGYWTTDRWKNIGTGTSGKVNMSQDTDAPDGFKYSTKFAVHTADSVIGSTEAWRVEQHIEAGSLRHLNYGVGSTTGKKITLSFWVKSNLTGNWSVGLYMDSTSGGTTTNKENSQTYTINSANTWEYKTLTFIPNTDTNMNSTDNDHGLRLWFHLAAGSDYTSGTANVWGDPTHRAVGHAVNFFSSTSNTWQYTGVQLEVGESATPFEHRSFADELQRCKRYFQKIISSSSETSLNFGTGQAFGSSSAYIFNELPVTMRAKPSLSNSISALGNLGSMTSSGGGMGISALAIVTAWSSADRVTATLTVASGSFTAGQVAELNAGGVNGAFIAYDAEL